ncbi:EF-hand domain-containing protein [Myxococcaceae bacterium GXIMD 01537]
MAKQKTAKQKSRKPAGAAKKKTAKRATSARKAASKSARKAAPKAKAKKAAPKAKARKTAPRAKAKKAAPRAAPRKKTAKRAARSPRKTPLVTVVDEVETTSAGLQPLAPEHAAVDDMTSSGNELLDIFQRYDRNRTGLIERGEFARILEALGQDITDEELEIALDVVDVDRTGKISWREFKNWWTSR